MPVWLVLLAAMPATLTATSYDAYVGLEGGYKAGDFDTAVEESLYSISAVAGVVGRRADASVTIPYVVADSDDGGSDSGLGDVVVRGGYLLVDGARGEPSLRGSIAVKLPTASENEDLGTGELDVGAFISLSQPVTSSDSVTASLGYIKTGDDRRIRYEDVVTYSVGVSHDFSRTKAFATLEGRSNIDSSLDDPLELHLGAFHVLDSVHMLTGDVFFGLSDGSPDAGVTIGVMRWF